jgi:steroid delta-isomerase-like uncharacterized protein
MAVTTTPKELATLSESFNTDVFNGRNYERMAELVADDAVQHGPLASIQLDGRDEIEAYLRDVHAGFSDAKATIDEQFVDGDTVISYLTYTGTHDGEFQGIPATDKPIETHGIMIHRVEDGKMVETWAAVDFLTILQQVGVLPEMGESAA